MSAGLGGSLKGLRILDASRVLAGPFAAQILADLGAEVIKVEQPGTGDETRGWGPPFHGDLSAYFMACNRGKRSVTIDLANAAGKQVFFDLASKCDVVLENFRADSAQDLGLTARALHAVNPRLVVCSISGFGRDGASKLRPGYDFVVQGLSGMMAATGPKDGEPSKFGVAIADLATAFYAVIAVLAGLRRRDRENEGVAVDLALIDCATATMANVAQACLTSGKAPARQGNSHLQIVPYQAFATKDGRVIIAVGNDRQFQRLAKVARHEEWVTDPRFATNVDRVRYRVELVSALAAVIVGRTTEQWVTDLMAADVPVGPVWDMGQLFASDLANERRLTIKARRPDGTEVTLVASPLVKDLTASAPPALGEGTDDVLRAVLGFGDADLMSRRRLGAFG